MGPIVDMIELSFLTTELRPTHSPIRRMHRILRPAIVASAIFAIASQTSADEYAEIVRRDKPAAWWRFEAAKVKRVTDSAASKLDGTLAGAAKTGQDGPRPERYPLFETNNNALRITRGGSFVRVKDPGKNGPLDFDKGDSITLEAWVNPVSLGSGKFMYVVGKGRTGRKGVSRDNQNYALRLAGTGGQAQITFLFRNHRNRPGNSNDYHRWTSKTGFPLGGWHHVAVTYTFGKADSLKGYIDGKPVAGVWDMGGKTDAAPVVDDDELWIGSSLGGQAGSTFRGGIDEVAIYRSTLSPERIRARFKAKLPKPYVTKGPLPKDGVLVEIMERLPLKSWSFIAPKPTLRYVEPAFGFHELPQKYDENGLRSNWSNPFLVRMTGLVELPKGELRLHVRSRSAARVFIDGKRVLSNSFHNVGGGGHTPIKDRRKIKEDHIRMLQPGDTENIAVFKSAGKVYRVTFEIIVGGKNKRPEAGETSLAYRVNGSQEPFRVFVPQRSGIRKSSDVARASSEVLRLQLLARELTLTPESWLNHLEARREALIELNAKLRREKSKAVTEKWQRRHEIARNWLKKHPGPKAPDVPKNVLANNAIDRFIASHAPRDADSELVNNWQFLRRVTLDVIGTVPTPKQIEAFFNDNSENRRANYIAKLLKHPGWADHWTGYWQDVLAENPNILKPSLNNTGPFRWWIYESLYDNKPMDRFVTELILMQGNKYAGGPAGFEMAAQNDVPMAAKAHVIGQAFLGVQMKCARCHDAPFHELKQRDLFSLAAMLRRSPQPVPKSSSIPLSKEAIDDLIVKVTLAPGSRVPPKWPFEKIADPKLPAGLLKDARDHRQRLAALITSPTNKRFAKVLVNRVWARLMGRGLVESVDDWEHAEPSHPQLLEWLSREFISSGYDLKHVASLILNSRTYQQRPRRGQATFDNQSKSAAIAPVRRRMTAEQVVDSMFVAAGKRFNAGRLNMDLAGARPYKQFLDLGQPRRAWQFTSLSNERDRPSLAMPYSQDFVSTLKTFGWRASRQDPRTERDDDPAVLQPAVLANGILTRRVTRLSDDGALTELAVKEQPLEQFIHGVYLRLLTRPPTEQESQLFVSLLSEGYESRVIDVDPKKVVRRFKRPAGVTWSNHLRPEANKLKLEMEKLVEQGDPPSVRLKNDWRLRAEDMVWALLNSPEFVFVP